MHISVPHILIQGVITRLSSAHSHHCLNHPPPPSSSSRQPPVPTSSLGPSPSSTFFTSSHHRPPVALLRRPDHPNYPARTFTTPQLEESSCRPVLPCAFHPLPRPWLKRHASLVSLSLSILPVSCSRPRVCSRACSPWGTRGAEPRAYIRVYRRLSRANSHNRYEINFDRGERFVP